MKPVIITITIEEKGEETMIRAYTQGLETATTEQKTVEHLHSGHQRGSESNQSNQ